MLGWSAQLTETGPTEWITTMVLLQTAATRSTYVYDQYLGSRNSELFDVRGFRPSTRGPSRCDRLGYLRQWCRIRVHRSCCTHRKLHGDEEKNAVKLTRSRIPRPNLCLQQLWHRHSNHSTTIVRWSLCYRRRT